MPGERLRIVSGPAAGGELSAEGELTIGRGTDGPGTLGNDHELSREHARLSRSPSGELTIQDLGSTNGTFVNGERISGARALKAGDRVAVGSSELHVEGSPPLGPADRGVGAAARRHRSAPGTADPASAPGPSGGRGGPA